jgi:hypothetical protein
MTGGGEGRKAGEGEGKNYYREGGKSDEGRGKTGAWGGGTSKGEGKTDGTYTCSE